MALASTWYIGLRAVVDWEQTAAGGGQRGTAASKNGYAFRGGGSVAGQLDSVIV